MKVSAITGKDYDPEQCIYILNMIQVARYLKHGAIPVDVCVTNDKVCFVFLRKDTRELYKAWCSRTLE